MDLYNFILSFCKLNIFCDIWKKDFRTSEIDVILSSLAILNEVEINFLEISSILILGSGITSSNTLK